jgi:excisionase family DNA binding protein
VRTARRRALCGTRAAWISCPPQPGAWMGLGMRLRFHHEAVMPLYEHCDKYYCSAGPGEVHRVTFARPACGIVNRQKGGSSHMPSDDEILTIKELCDLLRIHPATVYKLTRRGQIPGFRVGADWRFRKDAIMRWMVEQSMFSSQSRSVVHTRRNGECVGGARKR